ncbi:hypothetical protein ACTHQF_06690 [Pedobacter sp. SAFR-022]|uniref:hypothetical protein n=1 Tax=Pedobacter sp. SAFR-022 TaxID=3436861 RepID=UPI003F7CD990
MMQNDLKDKNSEAYKDKLKLAMKAFKAGCIIYSHETKQWYTPREFMDCDERVVFKAMGMEKHTNFTLLYPEHAIKKKLEDLCRVEQEFDTFMKKMLAAFKFSPLKADGNKN